MSNSIKKIPCQRTHIIVILMILRTVVQLFIINDIEHFLFVNTTIKMYLISSGLVSLKNSASTLDIIRPKNTKFFIKGFAKNIMYPLKSRLLHISFEFFLILIHLFFSLTLPLGFCEKKLGLFYTYNEPITITQSRVGIQKLTSKCAKHSQPGAKTTHANTRSGTKLQFLFNRNLAL